MIYRGDAPHPAHQGFAESVDADLLSLNRYHLCGRQFQQTILEEIFNGFILPKYDIYIVEGTRALYGSLTNQIISDSTLIYLAGDQALYKLLSPSYQHSSLINAVISKLGMSPLDFLFNKYIDGFIAVSEFSRRYTDKIISGKPSAVANPYIQSKLFNELGEITPDLGSKTATTVGSFAKYKGQDLLVDAWSAVRDEHPTAELHLVGRGYPSSYNDTPGVEVRGYVEDLPNALGSASLYVQPSRMDNFPVSVLEALRAGLPTVVTETTGNKEVVQKIDDNLVVEPNSERLASGISRYFNYTSSKKDDLSSQARSEGSIFDSGSRKAAFETAFNEVLSQIQQRD